MEALLTGWLAGAGEPLFVVDEGSTALAREEARRVAAEVGLGREDAERMAIVASELARNLIRHALSGWMRVHPVEQDRTRGMQIVAADRGAGIADPAAALRGGLGGDSLGEGLSAALRLSDGVDVDVRWGQGTCIRARKYLTPTEDRCEVGILGRGTRGELESGDHAVVVRAPRALVLAGSDGLGHGPDAWRASALALWTVAQDPGGAPDEVLRRCGDALRGTRGAAVGVGRIDLPRRELAYACGGNLALTVYHRGEGARSLPCTRTVIGLAGRPASFRVERLLLQQEDLIVMHTDGLRSRTVLEEGPIRRAHPVVIAQHLFRRFAREDDDALVLVARVR